MPMTTPHEKLAAKISEFLSAFESDPKINDPEKASYYNAGAYANGPKIKLVTKSYQGSKTVTIEEAEKYLAWLQEGWVGTYYDFERGEGQKVKVKPYQKPVNQPQLVSDDGIHGKRYTHPSWGTVTMHRTSGHATLFGSNLVHQHYITLNIGPAEKVIGESGDERVSGGMRGGIVEIAMSEAQLGQMLSSMNMGCGVPCTIKYVQKDRVPDCPVDYVTERFHATVKEDVLKLTHKLAVLEETFSTRFEDSKPLTKAEKKEMLGHINGVINELRGGMPFVLKMFEEKLEEQVSAAKAEIDGFLAYKMQVLGAQAVQDKIAVLNEGMVTDGTKALAADVDGEVKES